jgi:hypothetical protein
VVVGVDGFRFKEERTEEGLGSAVRPKGKMGEKGGEM